jgi:hypothetical protein
VSAPRVYDRASSLVDLWTLKMRKGHGRPFIAVHDLYLSTLDTICAVAFGMEADKAALGHQLAHVRAFNPGVSRDDDEPVDFPTAPLDDEHKALLNIPEMLALAQKSPTPTLVQYMALLKPKNAKAWWYRRSLIKRQTRRSLTKLAEVGESKGEGEQHHNMESALDHLLLREMNAARKASRQPDLHSAVIRDEVRRLLDVPGKGPADHLCIAARIPSWGPRHKRCRAVMVGQVHGQAPGCAKTTSRCAAQGPLGSSRGGSLADHV